MIYVVNKNRRIIIYLINIIGLIAFPFYKLFRWNLFDRRDQILDKLENGEIKSIAINCIDRLGDTLFLLPTVKAIKKRYPDTKLILITNKLGREIFKNNPYVDETILAENSWIGQSLVSIRQFFKNFGPGYFDGIREVKKAKIDLLIEQKGDFRNILLFDIWAGAKYLSGYAISGFGWMLDWEMPYKIGIHEIDARLNIAKELGADIFDRELDYILAKEETGFADDFYRKNNLQEKNKIVVMHIGGTWEPKLWPVERFSELAKRLKSEYGAGILLVGDSREKEKINKFISAVPDAVRVENLGIGQVAAIIKKADLFIGNDSGPVHLARSVKTPLIAIFGPEKTDRVGPENYGIAIRHDFPCSPCGLVSCNESPNCVQGITIDEVWEAVKKII